MQQNKQCWADTHSKFGRPYFISTVPPVRSTDVPPPVASTAAWWKVLSIRVKSHLPPAIRSFYRCLMEGIIHVPKAATDAWWRQTKRRVWKLHILNHIWLRPSLAFARHCALVSVTWVCLIGKLGASRLYVDSAGFVVNPREN